MDPQKRDFHDLSDDEDDSAPDDQTKEDSRFNAIPLKKRRLNSGAQDDASSESDGEDVRRDDGAPRPSNNISEKKGIEKLQPLTPAQLAASHRKAKKTGVIYISRVPPFMKPATVRKLLSPYGDLGRIFLTPEPTPMYQKRVRSGGNKKKSFVDGWVEFVSKKRAKTCVELLNGNSIGGRKGGFYHDDIWNLKYLKGFKWSDLMEQVQVEERMREGRLRAELQKESKERKAFLTNMSIARREEGIGLSKEDEDQPQPEEQADPSPSAPEAPSRPSKADRRFKQRETKGKLATSETEAGVQRVLRSIF